MKVLIQWTELDETKAPSDYQEYRSEDWASLPDVPIHSINIQGNCFSADHYFISNFDEGSAFSDIKGYEEPASGSSCYITIWNDDPDDWGPEEMWAEVWEIRPLRQDPNFGNAWNTAQLLVAYCSPNSEKWHRQLPQGCAIKDIAEFVIPTRNVRHGKWVSDRRHEEHVSARAIYGWRHWTEDIPAEDIDAKTGCITCQRDLGKYNVPDGTRTIYQRSGARSVLYVDATSEHNAEALTGAAANVSIDEGGTTITDGFAFTSNSDFPNEAAWPSGTYRAQLDCTLNDGAFSYGLDQIGGSGNGGFHRVNSTLATSLEVKRQVEAIFTGTGLKLATTGVTSWPSAALTDRIGIVITYQRGDAHGTRTLQFQVNEADDFIDGPWTDPFTPVEFQGSASAAATVNTPVSNAIRTVQDTVATAATVSADSDIIASFSATADTGATISGGFARIAVAFAAAPTSAQVVNADGAIVKDVSASVATSATVNAPVTEKLITVSGSATAEAVFQHACYIRIVPDIVGPTTEEWDAWGTLDQMVQTPVDQWSTAAVRNVGACALAEATASGDFDAVAPGGQVVEFSGTVVTLASVSAAFSRVRTFSEAVTATAVFTADAFKIGLASATVSAEATLIAPVSERIVTFGAASITETLVTGDNVRIAQLAGSATARATVTAAGQIVATVSATVATAANVNGPFGRVRTFSASVNTSANASGDFEAVSGAAATVTAVATVNAPVATAIKGLEGTVLTQSSVTPPMPQIIRVFSAGVVASAGVSNADPGVVLSFQASLSTIANSTGSFEIGGEALEPVIITSLGM